MPDYNTMTIAEMLDRLYAGNFTTGELERQLIAAIIKRVCDVAEIDMGTTPADPM